jgi:hypothetical protein
MVSRLMTTRVVWPGDHLAYIAEDAGFRDSNTVWDYGDNAELRALRKHPGVLAPDDVIALPEHESKQVDRPTGAHHVFKVKGDKLWLRLVVRDFDNEPVANARAILEVEGTRFDLVTDGGGRIDQQVPRKARSGTLSLPDVGLDLVLDIGMLDPVGNEAGWRARLVNLGYFRGDSGDSGDDNSGNERWDWALQEFQCDHDLPVTGEADDATRAKLLELCGS